jgi:hypothetical protein
MLSQFRNLTRCDVKRELVVEPCFIHSLVPSFFAQQDHRIDRKSAPGGNPRGNQTYDQHGQDDPAAW